VYLETRDLGATLHASLEALLAQMPADQQQSLAQIEQVLGAPLPAFLDPVEDAALGIGFSEGTLTAGIAATLSDPATAQTRVTGLLALVRLIGGQADAPFTVSDADVSGVPVTTITFSDAGMSGFGAPITPAVSIAVADDRLYLGLGDFAAAALTQDAGTSLSSDPRFAKALAASGTQNSGLAFVDLAAFQALYESMADPDETYTTDIKPWLDALDYLVVSSTADEDTLSTKAQLFVR
jgi:hypothetical protein